MNESTATVEKQTIYKPNLKRKPSSMTSGTSVATAQSSKRETQNTSS